MERGEFMYVFYDGRARMRKQENGLVIAMGRCLSQGADSPFPMKIVKANRFGGDFDSAMLTTMTFGEMSAHPGGDMHDDLMLKPKSWEETYKVTMSPSY